MMLGTELVAQWLGTDRATALAERVAGRSRLAVWQRVVDRLAALSASEARGYVRARAARIVAEQTQRLIDQEGAKVARIRGQIEAIALNLLIGMIFAQMEQRRQQAKTRRAA